MLTETKLTTRVIAKPISQPRFILSLTHNEIHCLEMALYFLDDQISLSSRHDDFILMRRDEVMLLNEELDTATMKSFLHREKHHRIAWPISSLVNMEWVILALENGVNLKTLASMANEHGHYARDMERRSANSLSDYARAEEMFHHYASHCYAKYSEALTCKPALIAAIRQQLS